MVKIEQVAEAALNHCENAVSTPPPTSWNLPGRMPHFHPKILPIRVHKTNNPPGRRGSGRVVV